VLRITAAPRCTHEEKDLDGVFSEGAAPDFDLVNLRLGFHFEECDGSLVLWGRKVLDEQYRMAGYHPPVQDGRVVATLLAPANGGVTLRKDF
jgi:hypothetical protein